MIISAWIVLILNAICGVMSFFKVFTGKTAIVRVLSFMDVMICILTCILSSSILRL